MRKSEWIVLCIVIISFILALIFWPKTPNMMASHWDSEGNVNGQISKFWGLFLMPIISVFLFLVFVFLPKMDPQRKNIEKFRKYFDGFIILLFLFLLYLYIITLLWNLGKTFPFIRAIVPAFAILMFYIGIVLKNAKMNWTIGIRTPWTLSSEKVWRKTHDIGGNLFMIFGVVCLLGLFVPRYAMWIVLAPLLSIAIFLFIYSYILFKKQKK